MQIGQACFLLSDLTPRGGIGDKLLMANKNKPPARTTNIGPVKAQAAAAREKRLAEALRENLKRRKTSGKTIGKTLGKKP
jgi:hypothetical protein